MPVATYKAPSSQGRFPRWGYLDKFDQNEFMPRAFVATLIVAVIAWGGFMGYGAILRALHKQHGPLGPVKKRIAIMTAADLGVPPSLTPQQEVQVKVELKTRPAIAMPKPVRDDLAVEETIASTEDIAAMSTNTTATALGATDSLVVSGDGLPGPEDYVAYEKEPELVSMQQTQYPEIAKEAGVEGEVLVRVLVGEDGFVKDLIIIKSVPMLDDAAATAAQTAVFKPALQKDKPVAVWMVIPIQFNLRN